MTVINLLTAALICWFWGKRNAGDYSTILFWTSGVIMALGGFSLTGSIGGRNNMGHQKARTIGTQDQLKRVKEDLDATEKDMKFILIAGGTGLIGFLISALILKF
ncbi:hypothetical protein [Haloimpatiens lingqiaonensis]|uniref:hypothetical protein n=2 Tax=Haloimpatiens lingqiaonensis TaxID=1380675 RepID=UPI0014859825|nr:hypothetical protein [Haloimpatiens lingqiaonensis]